jgi:hypothetical protein
MMQILADPDANPQPGYPYLRTVCNAGNAPDEPGRGTRHKCPGTRGHCPPSQPGQTHSVGGRLSTFGIGQLTKLSVR